MVDNHGEKLKKDMYCTVTVTAGEIQNAIAVPDAAVLRDDENQPFVYVAQRHRISSAAATWKSGTAQSGKTQIPKGLTPGDKVVGDGSLFLQFANSFQH